MEAHLHHFNMMRYEGYDQAIADESGGVVTLAALFKVKIDSCQITNKHMLSEC